jgi:hypothetical protein
MRVFYFDIYVAERLRHVGCKVCPFFVNISTKVWEDLDTFFSGVKSAKYDIFNSLTLMLQTLYIYSKRLKFLAQQPVNHIQEDVVLVTYEQSIFLCKKLLLMAVGGGGRFKS